MESFRRILVDVEALSPAHPALAQACDLAARWSASLTIVDVLPDVPRGARRFVTEAVEQEVVADRQARLAALVREVGPGVAIDTVVLRGRAGIVLIEEVLRGSYDLLMRSHGRRADAAARAFGTIDMQLLRQCPCPVWLVARDTPVRPRRVLAAVDAGDADEGERPLNQTIVDLAARVRDPDAGPVTVFYAWDTFGEELMRPRLPADDFRQFVSAAEGGARDALAAFVGGLGPGAHQVEPQLVKGPPEDVIPAYVREHPIDLVVMGTVARSGIAGLLIGNTAERVLQRLRVSVLAVKPEGFVSPVVIPEDAAGRHP